MVTSDRPICLYVFTGKCTIAYVTVSKWNISLPSFKESQKKQHNIKFLIKMSNKKHTKSWALFLMELLLVICTSCTDSQSTERKALFDSDWRFAKGTHSGAEIPDFDDSEWRVLDLPHDWSIEPLEKNDTAEVIGPFSRASVGGAATGQTVGGEGWYRKTFVTHPADEGKRRMLYFEGAYNQTEVWVNGEKVGENVYGYSAFRCDITRQCRPAGEENVVAVRVVNEGKNSRWYAGSGLYRHVWLVTTETIHLDEWETAVVTDSVSDQGAHISLSTTVFNDSDKPMQLKYRITVGTASKDEQVLQGMVPDAVAPGDSAFVDERLRVAQPKYWSPETPALYTALFEVLDEQSQVLDSLQIPFGIRTLEFSVNRGFLLNGRPVKMKGGCIHHDNGLLGAAAYDRAEVRKVELLKTNGFNAVRCSHNPFSEAFLHACDSLGMLVIDEAFDQWASKKNPQDYHLYFEEWSKRDLQTLVRRDRNHPSVIMWSIGNEIRERITDRGEQTAKRLREHIREYDTSRPVTAGVNKYWNKDRTEMLSLEKAFRHLDVAGYNYMWRFYEKDHEEYPQRVIYGSESVATELAPNWDKVERLPYVIGDFMWTAMDYLGESGIGNVVEIAPQENVHQFMGWPWYNGWCGDLDLCGVKKPQSYFRDVVWQRADITMAAEIPVSEGKRSKVSFWGWPNEVLDWTFPGYEGREIKVNVYCRAGQVRLYLNDRPVGETRTSEAYKAVFNVPYVPGVLRAVTLENGQEGKAVELYTTGEPAALRLTADRKVLTADGQDLSYILVELTDAQGRVIRDSRRTIEFDYTGEGAIIASGNGAPNDMKSFRSATPKFYNGRAMLIVKSGDKPGQGIVKVSSKGLPTAKLCLEMK